ncbi:MAG: hypothetical protein WCD70_01755 [Alphaproteobacteria bacterium]
MSKTELQDNQWLICITAALTDDLEISFEDIAELDESQHLADEALSK